jgi:excisionase family DNA binding protein
MPFGQFQKGVTIMTASGLDSEYMDIKRASEYFKLKPSTLYSLVEGKKIPHYKVGRLIRFKKSDIDLWMEGNKKEIVDISRAAKLVIGAARTPVRDVNKLVKKAVDDVKKVDYTASHRETGPSQGPRKGGS